MTHVIQINADGSAEAMHNDEMPLSFLGKQSIERATEIKFYEEAQKWGILFPVDESSPPPKAKGIEWRTHALALGFATYEGARQVEVAWLNACRLNGFYPLELYGLGILRNLRQELNL